MPGFAYEEKDECRMAKDEKETHDSLLAIAYQDGRTAGLNGLQPAGRPDDSAEEREWLRGYLIGCAMRKSRAA